MRAFVGLVCFGAVTAIAVPVAAQDNKLSVLIISKASPMDVKGYADAKLKAAVAMSESSKVSLDLMLKHGSNNKKWPAEARASQQQLSTDETRTQFAANYLFGAGLEVPEVEALIAPMSKEVGKSKALRVATEPKDADIVVEVLGCVALKSDAGLGVRLRPGGRVDEAAVVASAPAWGPRGGQVKGGYWGSTQSQAISANEPFWLVSGVYPGIDKNLPLSCGYAGQVIVVSLEAFAKDHRKTFAGSRKP